MVDWDTILKEEHMEGEATNTQTPAPAENQVAAAPIPIDSAKAPEPPAPDPKFDEAVAYVISKNYTKDAAIQIVNNNGIETILAGKAGETAEASGQSSSQSVSSNSSVTEQAKTEQAPEPGMKRCSACGIWYPAGYTACPHDNTPLQ
jgi:hypothetical protein